MLKLFIILLLGGWLPSEVVFAREQIAGPVFADVVRVRDGDSVDVIAYIWPGHQVRTSIRLRGIDAPELRARCDKEKRLANEARERLVQLLSGGRIQLTGISGGKYFGRVLARIKNHRGQDVQQVLLKENLVRRYSGGKRKSWCLKNLVQAKQ